MRCKDAELYNHKIEAFVKGLKSDAIKLEIVRELAKMTCDVAVAKAKSLEAFYNDHKNGSDSDIKQIRSRDKSLNDRQGQNSKQGLRSRPFSRDNPRSRSRSRSIGGIKTGRHHRDRDVS